MLWHLEKGDSWKIENSTNNANSIGKLEYENRHQHNTGMNVRDGQAVPHSPTEEDDMQNQMHCPSSRSDIRSGQNTVEIVAIASTHAIPASSSTMPVPPFSEPSHLRDLYRKQSFRLLIALIIVLSLSNLAYIIALSLLYDIEWSYVALISSLAFSAGQVLLWAIGGALWGHCADKGEERCMRFEIVSRGGLKRGFRVMGWVVWLVMVAVNVYVQVWLDTT